VATVARHGYQNATPPDSDGGDLFQGAQSLKKRYLTRAAAANTRTMITSSQNRPMPHIIPPMLPIMACVPSVRVGSAACIYDESRARSTAVNASASVS
jgi:hypothetical protein